MALDARSWSQGCAACTIQEGAEEVAPRGRRALGRTMRGAAADRTQPRQDATRTGELEEEEVEVEDCRNRQLEAPGDHPLEVALGLWLPCSLTVSLTQMGLNQPGHRGVKQLRYTQKCVNLASHTFCNLLEDQVGFPKKLPAKAGDLRDLGRSPQGGHGNPLRYSCLENPVDRGAWWASVHGIAKTQVKELSAHTENQVSQRT